MSTDDCRAWREQIGALALGGLWPDEETALRAHLSSCPECQAEADSLTRTAGLLALADPALIEAPAPEPPRGLAKRVAGQIAAERRVRRRRRRRWFATGGVAVAAAAAALFALVVLPTGSSAPDRDGENLAFMGLPQGVAIDASLDPEASGTQIHMSVSGIRSGTLCRVFTRQADGNLVPAGSFRYVYEDGDEPSTLNTAIDLAGMKSVVVHAGGRSFEQALPAVS